MTLISTLCLLLAATLAIPLLHMCMMPRFFAMFPRIVWTFSLATAGYWTALCAVAWWSPVLLPGLAAASITAWVWLWWRSRDDYGRALHLPPGSLAPLPLGPWQDRFHYMELGRRYGPIFKASHFFHPMICVMKLDSGLKLLKAHDDKSIRSPKVAADRFLPCGFLRGMDPEKHVIYRRLVQSLITPQVLAAWEPTIAGDLRPVLEQLSQAGEGVLAKPYWETFVRRSFSRLFFGIAPETPEFAQLMAAYDVVRRVSDRRIAVAWLPSERLTQRTLAELSHMFERQTAPGCLLDELRKQPEFAHDPQAHRLLVFMLYLAGSDVVGMLQWLLKTLCDHPEAGRQLRADVEAGVDQTGPEALARRLTLETLRHHQVEHLYRRVLEDFEWEGFRIPKGWLLRICLAEAHRDPEVFAGAAEFRPERFAENPPSQTEFLPFGAFHRSCVGDKVTHVIARAFLTTLTSEWNWRQVGQAHEGYEAWHWIPGKDFRVSLTKRGAEDAA